jgi:hypothetical protein
MSLNNSESLPCVAVVGDEFRVVFSEDACDRVVSVSDADLPFAVRVALSANGSVLHCAVPASRADASARAQWRTRYTPGKALLVKLDADNEADLSVELSLDLGSGARTFEFSLDVDEENAVLAWCFRSPDAWLTLSPPVLAACHAWARLPLRRAGATVAVGVPESAPIVAPRASAHRGRDVSTDTAFDSPVAHSPAFAHAAAAALPASSPASASSSSSSSSAAVNADGERVPALPIHLAEVLHRAPLSDAALALLPESLRFRHAVVRHIAWMCEPCRLVSVAEERVDLPALVAAGRVVPFADQSWLQALRARTDAQLHELDADPAPLIDWLSTPSRLFALRAVGTYFTNLLAFFLRELCEFSLVVSKVQVFCNKQTIGDIDMLFRVEENTDALAWELSIKNYVEVRDAQHFDPRATADDPLLPLVRYCGPLSTGDSLWNIVQRTHIRSSQLRARAEYKQALAAMHVDAAATTTFFLLRGYLFDHLERGATPPPPPSIPLASAWGGVSAYAMQWLSAEDDAATLVRLGGGPALASSTRYASLNKFDLSALIINGDDREALATLADAETFFERNRATFDDPARAFAITIVRLTADGAAWIEICRVFLLPREWATIPKASLS